MHVVLTVNAAWNILNFRKPILFSLREQGHRITVLAPPDDAVEALKDLGCEFAPLAMDAKGLSPMEGMRFMRRMRRHFQDLGPDIVLSYTIKNNIFGAMAAKRLGIPFLPNVTGLGTAFLSGGPLQFVAETLYRKAYRDLPVVFFQNADDQSLFLNRGLVTPGQARLLPGSGIDLDAFSFTPLPSGSDSFRFLMISRLLRDKGVAEYAAAARLVQHTHPHTVFQLLGPMGAENRTAISEEELSDWQKSGAIEYLGTAPDVRRYIADAHCIVLPSYREGAPRTLIEAAAMGRPLVATDVPGCRQVVREGETGHLCAVKNSQSLAEACIHMMSHDKTKLADMGRAARQHMEEEFDQRHVIAAYQKAIGEMVQRES